MVADVNKTIDFYIEVLGFQHVMSVPMDSEQILFEYSRTRPLAYSLIKHGEVEIMLQEQKSLIENVPGFGDDDHVIRSSAILYFEVDNVVELAEKLKQNCSVVRDLHDTFYGMKEIYVKDLNGYVLGFAQPQA